MRTIEEIKKDQDTAIFQLGYHVASAENWKKKVLELAVEAAPHQAAADLARKIEEEKKEKEE